MATCKFSHRNLLAPALAPTGLKLRSVRLADPIDGGTLGDMASKTDLGITIRAARVMANLQPSEQNAIEFVEECRMDKAPDTFPEWDMIVELFQKIRGMKASAYAFRHLLQSAAKFRAEAGVPLLNASPDVLEVKLYGMCAFLAHKARTELEEYEAKVKDAYRPADIVRAYGIALQYATEELGSTAARKMVARLMMATPLPWEEAINPDWVDPYTADVDEDYTYLKVREVKDEEVSNDGNVPALVQDLLDNLGKTDAQWFMENLKRFGSSLDEYWLQFKEAQRGGFANLPEPEDEREEPEFDVIEKDFQFKADLEVTEAVDKIKDLLILQPESEGGLEIDLLNGLKKAIEENIAAKQANFEKVVEERFNEIAASMKEEMPKPNGKQYDVDTNWKQLASVDAKRFAHEFFKERLRKDPRWKAFFRRIQELVWKFRLPDIMSVMLPFQNGYGILEEDLYQIKVGDGFRTLAHWFQIHGDEYLEQFNTIEAVDYGDPEINKQIGRKFIPQGEPSAADLDKFAWNVFFEQELVYERGEKQRVLWAEKGKWANFPHRHLLSADTKYERFMVGEPLQLKIRPVRLFQYKQDASWTPAYLHAELMAAFMGEGGSNSSQAAGWDAWRDNIDRDANAAYKLMRRKGATHAEAIAKFWELAKANRNRVASINEKGLKLRSGREINWNVACIKFKAGELSLSRDEVQRLFTVLKGKGWGPMFSTLLQSWLEKETATQQL